MKQIDASAALYSTSHFKNEKKKETRYSGKGIEIGESKIEGFTKATAVQISKNSTISHLLKGFVFFMSQGVLSTVIIIF